MTVANVATHFIDRHVQANLGHRRALELADKHYSYYDLAALANRAGNLLRSRGATAGARVLILMPESPAYVGCIIGAIKIGAVAVLATDEAAQRAAQFAIVHASLLGKLAAPLAKENVIVAGEVPDDHPSFVELMRAQPSSLAAEELPPEAPALTLGNRQLSQRALDAAMADPQAAGLGRIGELLRALADAQTARLS
jgi:acyl-CoA synthetase (AMP-forming)/AMP-acid ligase II